MSGSGYYCWALCPARVWIPCLTGLVLVMQLYYFLISVAQAAACFTSWAHQVAATGCNGRRVTQ